MSRGYFINSGFGGSTVVKYATIVASASGDTSIVSAVVGKKIRVLQYVVVANAAVNVKFRSGTTDITGLLYLAQNGGVSSSFNDTGQFETAVNQAFQINLSGAVAVGGHLTYIEV